MVGYAGFFINRDRVEPNEITLTLVRGAKPVGLFKELTKQGAKVIDGSVDGPAKGIYTIENWKVDFPIQIIVSTELEGDEYAFFRTISKNPSVEDIKFIVDNAEKETDPAIREFLRNYLDKLSDLNKEIVEKAKGRDPKMAKAWMDIFEPEIDERVNTAVDNTTRTNLYLYVQRGGMSADFAAKEAGLTVDQFQTQMNEYINSHKDTQLV